MTRTPAVTTLLDDARARSDAHVAFRRDLHANPEIGLDLPRTQRAILDAVAGLGLDEVRTGSSLTSVTGIIRGARPGPTVLLRGDMDALPVTEATGLEFASTIDGRMHACGHDIHTTMLLGAAQLLVDRRDALAGSVVCMFQPGEEGFHGARHMLDEGLLEHAPSEVVAAYALHVEPFKPAGTIWCHDGPTLAAMDRLDITISGAGGHAANPHQTTDPVPAAWAVGSAITTRVARAISTFDPHVVSITTLEAGSAHNIVPDRAVLRGTIRTLSPDVRGRIIELLREIATGVAAGFGCTADVAIDTGYPVTVNDVAETDHAREHVARLLGDDGVGELEHPFMGAEDFSYVLAERPGSFLFLGARPEVVAEADASPLHAPDVVFDESVLGVGAAVLATLALSRLDAA